MMKILLIFMCIIIFSKNTYSLNIGSDTGFKIPRYVSLKSNEANLRVGSSKNYPIILTYISKNLPLKVLDEYHVWRNVVDIEGNEGWIHKSLIKGDRYAIVNQPYSNSVQLLSKPAGKIKGKIGKNNIVKIKTCLVEWCLIEFDNKNGWINNSNLWGLNKNETINIPYYQFIISQFWKINFSLKN